MSLRPGARADLSPAAYVRHCNPTTGCSAFERSEREPWKPQQFWGNILLSATGELAWDPFDVIDEVEMTEGDVIFQASTGLWVRLRFTRQPDGRVCGSMASALVESAPDDHGATTSGFYAKRVTLPAPLPSSEPDEDPVFAEPCPGGPLTNPEVVTRYFDPGDTYSALGSPRSYVTFRRSCHSATGCSEWERLAYDDDDRYVRLVQLVANTNGLWVDLSFFPNVPIIDEIDEAVTTAFTGHVAAECVGITIAEQRSVSEGQILQIRHREHASQE